MKQVNPSVCQHPKDFPIKPPSADSFIGGRMPPLHAPQQLFVLQSQERSEKRHLCHRKHRPTSLYVFLSKRVPSAHPLPCGEGRRGPR